MDDQELLDIKIQRLRLVQIRLRWALVIFLWLTVGITSVWALRADIVLWLEYFTWLAVRVAIRDEPLPFMGLGVCVAMTLSTLMRQSWDILYGISPREYHSLGHQVKEIERKGAKHILWKWVIA
ncbi:hypothetical protein Syn7502_02961 [Synechococcus sp. PCC 7502]|uniref:hypothetical protein n=1 Tax=Synechococcus sp. PCC 7502 TaxID=1173263 RepID=UPI00029FC54B|nr:hypothetical protein [Synechococcus sp. PCC 7502]AFY74885.1 hypothetical protein Syn7502_02961 [Synechococcus sp. PCC 7502]